MRPSNHSLTAVDVRRGRRSGHHNFELSDAREAKGPDWRTFRFAPINNLQPSESLERTSGEAKVQSGRSSRGYWRACRWNAFATDLVSAEGTSNKFEAWSTTIRCPESLYRSALREANKVTFDFSVTFKAPIQRKR
jgi:hypothetical protein